jgi:hypothetical protein
MRITGLSTELLKAARLPRYGPIADMRETTNPYAASLVVSMIRIDNCGYVGMGVRLIFKWASLNMTYRTALVLLEI